MPYITASGVSIPQGTDAFTPPTQFKGWADAEATYDNFFNVNLDSDRTSLASPQLRDGIFCWVRTTQTLWSYQGTTWVLMVQNTVGTLTLGSGITVPGGYATKLEKNGTIVTLAFALANSATTPTAGLGSGTIIGTLPAGMRPQGNVVIGFVGYNNSGLVNISYTIETNGNLRAQPLTALGGGAILYGSVSFSVA